MERQGEDPRLENPIIVVPGGQAAALMIFRASAKRGSDPFVAEALSAGWPIHRLIRKILNGHYTGSNDFRFRPAA